jgi:hypothetical protein
MYSVNFPIEEFGEKFKMKTSMEVTHFAIVSNHCTTGHKLQGKSLDELIIAQWSKKRNWAYVVLSRVRSLQGLYLLAPLPIDIDFTPHPDYMDMMERLRNSILATPNDIRELNENF